MSDQTARKLEFPAACVRCGGRISEPVSFCPHCGARARLASVAGAAGASCASQGGAAHWAAATRFDPPARSFAPTDFDGDLDAPWADPSASPSSLPDGDTGPQSRFPAFRRLGQWGLKGAIGLLLGAFVVLYGGVAALHRYDEPSTPPGPEDAVSKSADNSIASNEPRDSNLTGSPRNEQAALAPAAPVPGASESAPSTAVSPHAHAGVSQRHPTSRAGAATRGRTGRGRIHGHARTYAHAHVKRRYVRSPDPTYLHVDAHP